MANPGQELIDELKGFGEKISKALDVTGDGKFNMDDVKYGIGVIGQELLHMITFGAKEAAPLLRAALITGCVDAMTMTGDKRKAALNGAIDVLTAGGLKIAGDVALDETARIGAAVGLSGNDIDLARSAVVSMLNKNGIPAAK